MYDPNEKEDKDSEYDGTGIYEGNDSCIWYDRDGDQHVEVKGDYSGGY